MSEETPEKDEIPITTISLDENIINKYIEFQELVKQFIIDKCKTILCNSDYIISNEIIRCNLTLLIQSDDNKNKPLYIDYESLTELKNSINLFFSEGDKKLPIPFNVYIKAINTCSSSENPKPTNNKVK